MKKSLLILLLVVSAFVVNAQAIAGADSLQHYVGKYVFSSGSPVAETVVVVKNGVLYATSDMGETELTKTGEADVFVIVTYSGLATFKRDGDGNVVSVKIEVGEMAFEGKKQSSQ